MRSLAALASLTCLLALSGCLAAVAESQPPPDLDRPYRVVAYGDSFTAAGVPGVGDLESISWATGGDPSVGSVLSRVRTTYPTAVGENAAISGARVRDLDQMWERAHPDADLVLVLLGINDYCWVTPTPLAQFSSDVERGFARMRAEHPDAEVIVYAIPDLWRMHELQRSSWEITQLWRGFDYCADTFGAPDVEGAEILPAFRRDSMNLLLKSAAIRQGFTFSDASGWPGWTLADLSPIDGFHPVASGEALLAEAAWSAVAPIL